MLIDEQLGETLVNKLSTLLKKRIMVFDLSGDVVASSDLAETGKNYNQVLAAIETNKEIEISKVGLKKLNPGIVIPLTFSGEVIGALFVEDGAEEYIHYIQILRITLELLIHQSVAIDHFPYKDKIKDNFVFSLLHRQLAIGDTKVREEADLLELQLDRDKVILILNIKDFWQILFGDKVAAAEDEKQQVLSSYKKEIFRAVSQFYGQLSGCTVAYFGSDTFVVMVDELYTIDGAEMVKIICKKSGEFQKILKERTGPKFPKILVAVGNFYRGKDGPAIAFEEASKALNLGLSTGRERDLYHIDDLGMLATLAGGNKKWQSDFVRRLITKMLGQEYLLETVEMFFENDMNITQTSDTLKIHRNTLLYRLDKIKKVCGLDPRKFNDAIELKIALILNQMLNPEKTTKVELVKQLT